MNIDENGNYATRTLEDGRTLYVFPLTYGRARLGVGNKYIPLVLDTSY